MPVTGNNNPDGTYIQSLFLGERNMRIYGFRYGADRLWGWNEPSAPPDFDPKSPGGLLFWGNAGNVEASDGVPQDSLYDISNYQNDARAVPGSDLPILVYDGINGRACLQFGAGGIGDLAVNPTRPVEDRTVFMVVQIDPADTPHGPFHAVQLQSAAPFLRTYARDGTIRTYTTPEVDSGVNWSGRAQMITVWCDSATQTQVLEVDGVQHPSWWSPSSSAGPFHLGGYLPGGYGMKGLLGSVLIYDHALSDEDRAGVHNYLIGFWGMY